MQRKRLNGKFQFDLLQVIVVSFEGSKNHLVINSLRKSVGKRKFLSIEGD